VTRNKMFYRGRVFVDQRGERELLGKKPLKMTLEKLGGDCLDVGTLRRFGIFGERRCTWSSLRWADITTIRADKYSIELEMPRKASAPQEIRVSWTRCRFGGLRPWLHCPYCQRRGAKLFNGLAGYCCRACVGNPPYASQTKSAETRRHFEACKLRMRLGGSPSLTEPFPKKPKGMHRRTYVRLKRRGEQLEARISPRLRAKSPDYSNLVYHFDR
jgi:hypothetical protein